MLTPEVTILVTCIKVVSFKETLVLGQSVGEYDKVIHSYQSS